MQNFLTQQTAPTGLAGTTWLITETKNRFCAFYITFNADGTASAITVNKYFTGSFTWTGDVTGATFTGSFSSVDKGTMTCISTPDAGDGHYTYTSPAGTQTGKFTMVQQNA